MALFALLGLGFTRRLPGSTAQVTIEGAAGEPASGSGGEPAPA